MLLLLLRLLLLLLLGLLLASRLLGLLLVRFSRLGTGDLDLDRDLLCLKKSTMNPDSASYSLANLAAENVNESDDDFQVQIALSSRYPAL